VLHSFYETKNLISKFYNAMLNMLDGLARGIHLDAGHGVMSKTDCLGFIKKTAFMLHLSESLKQARRKKSLHDKEDKRVTI
jgi:hypothetical protein